MTHRLPVIAPVCCTVHGRWPLWEQASPIPFDDEPCLRLPYQGRDIFNSTRVFFDRRQYRAELYRKRIRAVGLERDGDGWVWVVEVNG